MRRLFSKVVLSTLATLLTPLGLYAQERCDPVALDKGVSERSGIASTPSKIAALKRLQACNLPTQAHFGTWQREILDAIANEDTIITYVGSRLEHQAALFGEDPAGYASELTESIHRSLERKIMMDVPAPNYSKVAEALQLLRKHAAVPNELSNQVVEKAMADRKFAYAIEEMKLHGTADAWTPFLREEVLSAMDGSIVDVQDLRDTVQYLIETTSDTAKQYIDSVTSWVDSLANNGNLSWAHNAIDFLEALRGEKDPYMHVDIERTALNNHNISSLDDFLKYSAEAGYDVFDLHDEVRDYVTDAIEHVSDRGFVGLDRGIRTYEKMYGVDAYDLGEALVTQMHDAIESGGYREVMLSLHMGFGSTYELTQRGEIER
ncbi:MAG: hypothetical protein OXR66_03715 [Candidatus Woesearchaeota archaeon]|nr:hypothetical protein [Candidatus Woesearchaeota archaeon]